MYGIVIILCIILLAIYHFKNRAENSSEVLSRTTRWKNSLTDDVSWWDNAKKSGEVFILGTP